VSVRFKTWALVAAASLSAAGVVGAGQVYAAEAPSFSIEEPFLVEDPAADNLNLYKVRATVNNHGSGRYAKACIQFRLVRGKDDESANVACVDVPDDDRDHVVATPDGQGFPCWLTKVPGVWTMSGRLVIEDAAGNIVEDAEGPRIRRSLFNSCDAG